MSYYIIRTIPVGRPISDTFISGTRLDARAAAKAIAEREFPGQKVKGAVKSSDSFTVSDKDDTYLGCTAVELPPEWLTEETVTLMSAELSELMGLDYDSAPDITTWSKDGGVTYGKDRFNRLALGLLTKMWSLKAGTGWPEGEW